MTLRTSFDLSEGYMPGRRNSTTPPDWIVDAATGCWIWQKWCDPTRSGYPKTRAGLAHRVLYEHVHGQQPEDVDIHHVCHNKLCVNPEHMEARPWRDHRAEHWLAHNNLTWDQLRELHAMGADPDVTAEDAERRYGLARENVIRLWQGQTWPELGGPSKPKRDCLLPSCGAEVVGRKRNAKFCGPACAKKFNNTIARRARRAEKRLAA